MQSVVVEPDVILAQNCFSTVKARKTSQRVEKLFDLVQIGLNTNFVACENTNKN